MSDHGPLGFQGMRNALELDSLAMTKLEGPFKPACLARYCFATAIKSRLSL